MATGSLKRRIVSMSFMKERIKAAFASTLRIKFVACIAAMAIQSTIQSYHVGFIVKVMILHSEKHLGDSVNKTLITLPVAIPLMCALALEISENSHW